MQRNTLVLMLLAVCSGTAIADDWPQWGGPKRDIVWRESGIVKEFETDGLLPRKWSTPIAGGYSGPAVADGRVYITDRERDKRNERVLCLDAETGNVIWKHEHAVKYTVSYDAGPRATPVVHDGLVYTIGAMGDMFCFSADKGDIVWEKQFTEDFGTKMPIWGMAASPLIDGDQLITLVGGQDALIVSFDRKTGEEKWRALNDPMVGYAPPVIYEFEGTRQLIIWHPQAVTALNPDNGKQIWTVPFPVKAGLTIPMPRQAGNKLFVTAFYNGPMMLDVTATSATVAWKGSSNNEIKTDGLHSIMPTPVVNGSNIFGVCSYGQLRGLETQTGKRLWETLKATGEGRWWNAFIIPHEDRYFLHNEQGDLIIANLTSEGYEEVSRAKLVEPTRRVNRRMTIWSHPAFAMQSVFARNDKEIVRVDLSAKK